MSEYIEEEEDWDEEEQRLDGGSTAGEDSGPGARMALGFLACIPLLAAYELALGWGAGASRSTAELCLFRFLAPLGPHVHWARMGIVAFLGVVALAWAAKNSTGVLVSLVKVVGEGIVWALIMGPVLLMLTSYLGVESVGALVPAVAKAPSLDRALFILGTAAHEELFFRVIVYSGLYLVLRTLAGFMGAGPSTSRWSGELIGLVGSAAVFSALHLEMFTTWLGPGGEAFEAGVFLWRLLAGVMLGILLRWRGPGVAAWSHALFNLGLLLGAGPQLSF